MTIATNDRARIFMFPRGVNDCVSEAVYVACLGVDGLSQDNGDVNKIECPDPFGVGYKEVGVYRGERGRMTTTLTGRLEFEQLSLFRGLFDRDCPIDIHVHWGACTDLDAFNQYSVAWVMQNVYVTNWGGDIIIASMCGDRNGVNETIDISVGEFFQIKAGLNYANRSAGLTITTPLIDLAVCGRKACQDDVCPPSDGCDKIYALGTDQILSYTTNDGATWFNLAIPVANQGTTPVNVLCVCGNVAVFYDNGVIAVISRADLDLIRTGTTTLVASPFLMRSANIGTTITLARSGATVDYGGPFLINDDGSLYRTGDKCDPSCGVYQLEDLSANPVTFHDAMGNDGVFVAVGEDANGDGAIYVYRNNSSFAPAPTVPTTSPLHAVLVKNRYHWIVGGEDGNLWCTSDAGYTWTQVCFPGYNATPLPTVTDLCSANDHTVWMAAGGTIYRSVDGGATWSYEPNTANAVVQLQLRSLGSIAGVSCCATDANRVWAYGNTVANGPLAVLGTPT